MASTTLAALRYIITKAAAEAGKPHAAVLDGSRFNGPFDAEAARAAGYCMVVWRCTVGWSYVDPLYEQAYIEAHEHDFPFGAYGVNWPINRAPKREARWFVDHLIPKGHSAAPLIAVCDEELGVTKHAAGHDKLGGEELFYQNRLYFENTASMSSLPTALYTGSWYWNDPKFARVPGLKEWGGGIPLIAAHYPFRNGLVTPDVLDPWTVLGEAFFPQMPNGFSRDNLWLWQWSCKGRVPGMKQPKPWDQSVAPAGDRVALFRQMGIPSLSFDAADLTAWLRRVGLPFNQGRTDLGSPMVELVSLGSRVWFVFDESGRYAWFMIQPH